MSVDRHPPNHASQPSAIELSSDTDMLADLSHSQADPAVKFFDQLAEEYDRRYSEETPAGYALRIRREKVLSLFDAPGGTVLDVGCGPGVMVNEMLQRGCSFWGVDPSPKMIDMCRNRFREGERVHFVLGDAMRLELPDGFFDAVLCMGVADALRDRRLAVREMLRVLKPGGTLIVTFTNLRSPYALWKNYVYYPLVSVWHGWRDRIRDRGPRPGSRLGGKTRALYTERQAAELLQSEGAGVVSVLGYYFNVFLSPLDEVLPSGALFVTRKLEEGPWASPGWLAAGLIFKARKIQ